MQTRVFGQTRVKLQYPRMLCTCLACACDSPSLSPPPPSLVLSDCVSSFTIVSAAFRLPFHSGVQARPVGSAHWVTLYPDSPGKDLYKTLREFLFGNEVIPQRSRYAEQTAPHAGPLLSEMTSLSHSGRSVNLFWLPLGVSSPKPRAGNVDTAYRSEKKQARIPGGGGGCKKRKR